MSAINTIAKVFDTVLNRARMNTVVMAKGKHVGMSARNKKGLQLPFLLTGSGTRRKLESIIDELKKSLNNAYGVV